MYTINLDEVKHKYDKGTKTFTFSEKDLPFGTEYELVNKATGGKKVFGFQHSTGPEFHKDTKWIYKSDDLIMEVCNDPAITKQLEQNYLRSKLGK